MSASFAAATADAFAPGLHPTSRDMQDGPRTAFETILEPYERGGGRSCQVRNTGGGLLTLVPTFGTWVGDAEH